MALIVRQSNTWSPRAGSVFWVRAGEQWRPVAYVSLRWSEIWRHDPYVGVPGAPTGLHIASASNNYSTVDIAWNAPSGGAPAASYNVQMLNNGGGVIGAWNTGNTFFNGMGVNWDTQYIWRVWSVSSGGVQSGSYVEVRYQIGHPQQTSTHLVTHTVPYDSGVYIVDRAYREQQVGPYIQAVHSGGTVSLTNLIIHLHVNNSTSVFVSSLRNGVFIVAGQVYGTWQQSPWQPNPWDQNKPWGQTTPGIAGVKATDSGWSSAQTGAWTYSGTLQAQGTETYQSWDPYVTATELNNSFW